MPLIDAARARRLSETATVILDVRWSLAEGADTAGYRAGHLPGARFVDLDADLCGAPGRDGRHPLPDPDRLRERLRAWGVRDSSTILVYDGGDMMAAARAWWTLRWAGLSDVHVLNGGWAAWRRAGGEISTVVPEVEAGDVSVVPGGLEVLDAGDAARLAAAGELYDVREPERFRGEHEPIDPVAGHIPGARNLPGSGVLAPQEGLADTAALRELFDAHPAGGFYCGSGITAARTALAATQATGVTPPVYIGSWSEWVASGQRPVEVGDG